MLSEAEALSLATAYAGLFYGKHGTDYRLLLRATLHDPPGFFFTAEYASPLRITGDAGFFLSQVDGRIIHLGTGDFPHGSIDLATPTDVQWQTMLAQAIRRRATPSMPTPPDCA